ncbi:hypothetical protein [Clostridium beijerinckii]|uniref:Uncharacterized protein n=1 Tax=Clostridium beijerinckii TaxID=1520 RepID=A0AAE5LPT8_CLOBE|nr:hypothetical protein [Clostridium beijerinckii]NSB14140.1 hypothetical protein [Clostridium beijerinckii]
MIYLDSLYLTYFSLPKDSLLILFLKYSKELRDFYEFTKVPNTLEFTHFNLAYISIFNTSGIKAYITENNPLFAHRIIVQLNAYAKAMNFDKNYTPYKTAYKNIPFHASANPAIKQLYINGHFCHIFKLGVITNGLGITIDITFHNEEFMDVHQISL